jgi:hypothetical protein
MSTNGEKNQKLNKKLIVNTIKKLFVAGQQISHNKEKITEISAGKFVA